MFAVHPRKSVSHDSQVALPLTNRVPLPPHPGDRINCSMLSCRDMAPWLSIHSPTTKWGEGGGASHQRGSISSPAGRLYGFPTGESPVVKVLCKTGAFYNLKAPYLASAAILYNSRGREPSTRPGGVSRSRTEPLAPRAKGPAAPSTLARESGRQPSGILESTAPPRSRPRRKAPLIT